MVTSTLQNRERWHGRHR